jgi:hypothetical protein
VFVDVDNIPAKGTFKVDESLYAVPPNPSIESVESIAAEFIL